LQVEEAIVQRETKTLEQAEMQATHKPSIRTTEDLNPQITSQKDW